MHVIVLLYPCMYAKSEWVNGVCACARVCTCMCRPPYTCMCISMFASVCMHVCACVCAYMLVCACVGGGGHWGVVVYMHVHV